MPPYFIWGTLIDGSAVAGTDQNEFSFRFSAVNMRLTVARCLQLVFLDSLPISGQSMVPSSSEASAFEERAHAAGPHNARGRDRNTRPLWSGRFSIRAGDKNITR
jgi:hypothetical protein